MKLASHVSTTVAGMFILVLTAALSAAFAQEKQKPVSDLAREADVVAVGRVTALKSEWDEGKTRIVTRVTLSVDEYLKAGSERSKSVTIVTLGGEVDEVGEFYTHVPTFRQSEAVVVFLKKDTRGAYNISGGTQGKYSMERNPESGKMMVAGNVEVDEFTRTVKQALNR